MKKQIVYLVGTLAVIVAVTLAVQQARPAPTIQPNVADQGGSQEPKITWSKAQLEATLSPGQSKSFDLTFTSNLQLKNIVIEPVPELAPFLTVQPSSFIAVPAGSPQSVHVTFLIPRGASLGIYEGTLHVRSGSQTFSQTLKIAVRVGVVYQDQTLGITLLYPPEWDVTARDTPVEDDPTLSIVTAHSEHGSSILVLPRGGEGYDLDERFVESDASVTVSGFPAKRRDFRLSDGTLVLVRFELAGVPNLPDYRVEYRIGDVSDLPMLEFMLQSLLIHP